MNNYNLILTHDNGTYTLCVTARNEEAAIQMAMEAEGCPRRAITHIVLVD